MREKLTLWFRWTAHFVLSVSAQKVKNIAPQMLMSVPTCRADYGTEMEGITIHLNLCAQRSPVCKSFCDSTEDQQHNIVTVVVIFTPLHMLSYILWKVAVG